MSNRDAKSQARQWVEAPEFFAEDLRKLLSWVNEHAFESEPDARGARLLNPAKNSEAQELLKPSDRALWEYQRMLRVTTVKFEMWQPLIQAMQAAADENTPLLFTGIADIEEAVSAVEKWAKKQSTKATEAPTRSEILDHDIVYAYDYTLIVGALTEIRDYVYQHAQRGTLPEYTFTKDRQSWTLTDARDGGWKLGGAWAVTFTGPAPQLVGPNAFWAASDLPAVQLEAAFDTGSTTATLRWEGLKGQGGGAIDFEVIPDGAMRTYTIDLSKVEGYSGIGTRFVLAPKTDGAEGRKVTVARLGAVK